MGLTEDALEDQEIEDWNLFHRDREQEAERERERLALWAVREWDARAGERRQ